MITITRILPFIAVVLAGCTSNQTSRSRTAADRESANPDSSRRMVTGSHVPQPLDRPTFDNLSANVPVGSAARKPDSLIPSELTVGARGQSEYRLNEPSTGAGPEGSAPQPTPN